MFLDESGFLLQPVRRRTWAPRGQTPIQRAWDRHDRLSGIAALSLTPHNLRIGLCFQLLEHNVRTDDFVTFVKQLHRQLRRDLILVMDRYSVHRSGVRRLTEAGCRWLSAEWLPPYAPELNPVEFVWNHTKYSDLANFVPEDVQQLHEAVLESIDDQQRDTWLKRSFFRSAGLAL